MIITNSNTPWACYKDPKSLLIFFVHSKCACSFYKLLFDRLEWIKCTTQDIQWNTDIVFSHIRNPINKHRMGIIEWFYYNKKIDLLIQNSKNNDFFSMIAEIAYLDIHSMSIYEHLSDNAFNVQWIPIDHHTVNHRAVTINLIKQHSVIPEDVAHWFLNLPPVHVSDKVKKDYINQLMAIPPSPLVIKSLEIDQVLYDRATIQRFEPLEYPVRIAELLKNGHTREQAETIADNEVFNGTWQKWVKPKKINK